MNALLQEARLPREACLLWNIIPWYIGDGTRIRAARRADVHEALPYLKQLLALLSCLRAVVLVGNPAGSAAPAIADFCAVPVCLAPHPSPKAFNIYPHKRAEALAVFGSLRKYLRQRA
jgi:uracil-DNA glycosylase